jgi:hypothetical protein
MRALVLVALGGCRWVFGIEGTVPANDDAKRGKDGPQPTSDATADAPACAGTAAPLIADSMFDSQNPNATYGSGSLISVSATLGTAGFFKFDISAASDPTTWTSAQLVLPFDTHDNACGAICGSCGSLERGGRLHLYALTSNWDESAATYNNPWDVPGAAVATDQSVELVQVTHQIGADTTFTIGSTVGVLKDWASVLTLSFIVRSTDGGDGVATIRSREGTCDNGAPAARLTVYACP